MNHFRSFPKNLLRAPRYWWQRRTRGWDDRVTWNLDQQLAQWLAPRLRRFRELNDCYPNGLTYKEWNAELDEMIWAAEWYTKHAYDLHDDLGELTRAKQGLQQVTKRFTSLWW